MNVRRGIEDAANAAARSADHAMQQGWEDDAAWTAAFATAQANIAAANTHLAQMQQKHAQMLRIRENAAQTKGYPYG